MQEDYGGYAGRLRRLCTEKEKARERSVPDGSDNNQEMRIFHSAKSEMMGMTTVFNASGVDKENFVKYTEENPFFDIFTQSSC